jgi:hypothetical protein
METAHSFKTSATHLTYTQCPHPKTGLTLLFDFEDENCPLLMHASHILLPDEEP